MRRVASLALCVAGLVAACTGPGVREPVRAPAAAPDAPAPPAGAAEGARLAARIDELLAAPLTQDSAAELAVLASPVLARVLGTLGIAAGDRLRTVHVPSPRHEGGQPLGGAETRIERPATANLLSWIAAAVFDAGSPLTRAERAGAAEAAGNVLFGARRAWVDAVAAREALRYREDVAAAAEVARDIAERMRRVGNAPAADALRAQRFHAESVGRLAQAQADALIARERLAAALGLWGETIERLRLPDRLPEPPDAALGPDNLEVRAVSTRLDVQMARAGTAPATAEEVAVRARGEVRAAWIRYRSGWEQARHARDALLPLAQRISGEELRRYNGMLAGVHDLLNDAIARIGAVVTVLEARREFWLAEIDLQQALAGAGSLPVGEASRSRPDAGPALPGHH